MNRNQTKNKRILKEAVFHDRRFEGDVDFVQQRTSPFYSVARRSFKAYREKVFNIATDGAKRVLEYGCGDGSLSLELAGCISKK